MSDASVRAVDGRAVVTVGGSELLSPITAAAKLSAEISSDQADAAAGSAMAASLAESGAVAANGTLYPTTAAGLAATAANGFFTVVGDGTATYAILYQKVSNAAVEKARYASKAAYEGGGGAALIGSASPVAPGIVRSAQSMFEGSPDLLDIIGGFEKTKIRNNTSTVAIDNALDDYISWMGTNQKRGLLRMSGGRAILNRAHTINVRNVQMMLSGEFDMRGIPDNSVALTIQGRSADDLGGRSTSRNEISGLSLLGPGGTPGAAWGRGCTGIEYVDVDHLLMRRTLIRDFVTGITNGDNAYIIGHDGGRITGCKVGYYGAQKANAGERIGFHDYTFDAMQVGIRLASSISDVVASKCSFDYPVDLTSPVANGMVRFVEVLDGRLATPDCHFEGGNSGNPMGGLSPFYVGPNDSASLVMITPEVLFGQDIMGVPIFENQNSVNPMIIHHLKMQGGYGFDSMSNGALKRNTSVLSVGNVEIKQRPARGAPAPAFGPTFNGGIVSRYNNKFTGLADLGIAEDGAGNVGNGGITSGTIGTNLRLVATGSSDTNGVPQVYAQKTSAVGVLATFNIAIPINGNSLVGFETFLTKTAALTGKISISTAYAAVHRQGDYVLVVDRVGASFDEDIVVDLSTLDAATPKRIAFGGISRRSEGWANCAIVSVQMQNAVGSTDPAVPAQLFLSSTCMTEM